MTLTSRFDVNVFPLVGLVAAAGILLTGVFAPVSAADGPIRVAVAVFFATVVLWITKPVPYAVSSLLCVILLYALGLTDTFQDAVAGFASTLVFFFVLLLLVGKSVAKVGLDDYVADRLVSTKSTPRMSVRRLAVAHLALAFLMPSGLARAVTFMPIVDQINGTYDLENDSDFRRLSYYLIGHITPVASLVVMTGGGMPIVTSELINSQIRPFTWLEWLVYMAPPVVLLYTLSVIAANLIYEVGDDVDVSGIGSERPADAGPTRTPAADEPTAEPNGGAHSLTRDQAIVVATLLVAVVFWVVGSFVGIPAIVPAMGAVFVFSLPGVEIITTDEIGDISWGIVFLIGAMLSLLEVMRDLGAFDLIIDVMFSGVPMFQVGVATMFVLFVLAALIRGAFSSVSVALVLLLPVLLEFATILELDRLYVSLALPIVLSSTVFLPFNIPTVLIAHERGPLTRKEIAALGMMTLLLSFLVAAFGWFVYWPALEGALGGLF